MDYKVVVTSDAEVDLDNFIKCKDLNIEVKIEWKFATNRVDID